MDRKDLIPVVILITLLFLWGPLSRMFFPPPPPADIPSARPERTDVALEDEIFEPAPEIDSETVPDRSPAVVDADRESPETRRPEQRIVLANEHVEVLLSSWGAGVQYVRLFDYRSKLDHDSEPMVLEFGEQPALTYGSAAGFSHRHDFSVVQQEDDLVYFKAETDQGLVMIREFEMDPDNPYRFFVRDIFEHTGDEPLHIGDHDIRLGPFAPEAAATARTRMAGADLSLDALPSGGGQRVRHWTKKRFLSQQQVLSDLFHPGGQKGRGCSPFGRQLPEQLPESVEERISHDTDWIAVKNKFFVQILAPRINAAGYRFSVTREVPDTEHPNQPRSWSSVALPNSISAALLLEAFELEPGETFEHHYSYYAGPKKLTALQPLGNHQEEVMEFGRLRFFCRILLHSLNGLHRVIRNYGIAVMLLTIIIRVLFWPITRKSTESMKRMQELQPEMKALRERYKDNPQKMQQETMALYKKHKVNPVAGCLPMLIQIPVFFALFTVLRSAVELRFADFLWIRDLSEPENLLAGFVPLVGSLNILPILMTVTMVWQQHLTPSAGDPSQRKMMMFMPIIMLVFFYSMPSALVLYWTTNQGLMIVQLMLQRKRKENDGQSPTTPTPPAVSAAAARIKGKPAATPAARTTAQKSRPANRKKKR